MGDTYFDVTRNKQFACFCQTCFIRKTEEEISNVVLNEKGILLEKSHFLV